MLLLQDTSSKEHAKVVLIPANGSSCLGINRENTTLFSAIRKNGCQFAGVLSACSFLRFPFPCSNLVLNFQLITVKTMSVRSVLYSSVYLLIPGFTVYHFHPLHRHLDISRKITTESSPLHIASSRTRTGNLSFLFDFNISARSDPSRILVDTFGTSHDCIFAFFGKACG